jgi:hypothetical protein
MMCLGKAVRPGLYRREGVRRTLKHRGSGPGSSRGFIYVQAYLVGTSCAVGGTTMETAEYISRTLMARWYTPDAWSNISRQIVRGRRS